MYHMMYVCMHHMKSTDKQVIALVTRSPPFAKLAQSLELAACSWAPDMHAPIATNGKSLIFINSRKHRPPFTKHRPLYTILYLIHHAPYIKHHTLSTNHHTLSTKHHTRSTKHHTPNTVHYAYTIHCPPITWNILLYRHLIPCSRTPA